MLTCKETAALLRGWDDILVVCHENPDGDALGSMFGLVRGLRSLGKRAGWYCADVVPGKFAYLSEGLQEKDFTPAHVLTVDVADSKLLGDAWEKYGGRIELAIDHHSGHRPFANARWVEPESAANSELVYLLLNELGVHLDKAMADCLYTGITTDTGCFRYTSVTPRTHRIAAALLELGADGPAINRKMFENKSRARVEAEHMLMENMTFSCGGKCAMMQVPLSIYERTGVRDHELEGVASLPRQMEGVLLGVILKEKADGSVKGSVRSNPPANAQKIGEVFGGGGHPGAAGFTLPGVTMAQSAEQVEAACRKYLEEIGEL